MHSRLSLLLLVVLVLFVVVESIPVPFTSCSSSSAHLQITSVNSDAWPPSKGDNLNISFVGNVDESVTAGEYTVKISWNGFPLPADTGDINDVHPLPWNKGPLAFSFIQEIPSESPSGSYTCQLSAVDQSKAELFCVHLSFKLALSDEKQQFPTLRPVKTHSQQEPRIRHGDHRVRLIKS